MQSNLPLIPPEGPQVTWSRPKIAAEYKIIQLFFDEVDALCVYYILLLDRA